MDLRKKIKLMIISLLLCLVVLFSASYAWLVLALAPEVTDIDTNVGANGSLEIALLSDQTYVDPQSIRTAVGSSGEVQDALISNQYWGNVIELSDERYGMGELSLKPARMNLTVGENGSLFLNESMLKIAEFGLDGRIGMLSAQTVSAVYEERAFTYYVANQRYGVRAIGTLSHITAQQTALAAARTTAQSHTAAASRTAKSIWKDKGAALMDIFSRRYENGEDRFTGSDVAVIRDTAAEVQKALDYADLAFRQGVIGLAAARMTDEPEFERFCSMVRNTAVPLSSMLNTVAESIPGNFGNWTAQLEQLEKSVLSVVVGCNALSGGGTWEQIEPLLDVLVDADKAYLGQYRLATEEAFSDLDQDNVLTLSPGSGAMAKIAEYAGNYSTFFRWTERKNVEVITADPVDTPYLIHVVDALKNVTAATGGWTRANLDDSYGYAMDLAFRCNTDSDLLLQTVPTLRAEETSEFPVTQGGGSYMRFTSDHMDTEALLKLMDTIRVGFLNDRSQLVGVAKLNITNYEEQEEGVFAPLYLYDHTLQESGMLTVEERREDNAQILHLSRNIPAVVTVVVWLDGDHVGNGHVGALSEQSMSGVLNLQFSSSADLRAVDLPIKNGN